MAKILVVEDDDMLKEMMVEALGLMDHEVSTAANGCEALARVEACAPDLILMDIGMPEMDGCEATRRLKASESSRGIPIVALTAHASNSDRQKVLEAGADDYESKPVDFGKLFQKIDTLLERSCQ